MDCNFNRVRLCGRISSDPALSHVNHGETFYRFVLSVQRLSGQCDDLPEWAFFNVGTLEDARQKAAEKMAEEKGGAV